MFTCSIGLLLLMQTASAQNSPQNPACPQEVSGTHGAKLLGADTFTSDIVINACVAMGGNAQQLINTRQDSACTVTSGYRSPQHNAEVGGANASQHVQGRAIDVVVKGQPLRFGQLLLAGLCCKNRCVGGLGYYNRNLFHVDNRQSVMAWGPDYTTNGIAQIQDPQMRNLLQTYLRNGASVQNTGGPILHPVTGQPVVDQNPQSTSYSTPTGVQEDGRWATTGQYTQQQNTTQQQQPQPYTSSPYTAQYYQQPTTLPTTVTSGTGVIAGTREVPNPVDEIVQDDVPPVATKPSVSCTPNASSTRVTIEWSCGSTSGKKVWVEGRGFNARRLPVGTVQIKMPTRTMPYSIDCYNNGKIIARASCIVKVPKKAIEQEGSFSVTGESGSPQSSWCIFKTCLW